MATSFKPRVLIGLLIVGSVITVALWERHTSAVTMIKTPNTLIMPHKINSHQIPIQSEIHGKILKIHIQNNQAVKRGDILIELDPEYYAISLEQAKAQLIKAQRQSKTDVLSVQASQALLTQREAELAQQEALLKRKETLALKGYFPKQQLAEATTQVAAAKAAVMLAKTQLEKAQMIADPNQWDPLLAKAVADLKKATMNLHRTKIIAPVDGIIVEMELYIDQVIAAYQPLLTLEPSKTTRNLVKVTHRPLKNKRLNEIQM